MKILIKNVNLSVSLSLTALRFVGFWSPEGLTETRRLLYNVYTGFSFMFLLGTYLIIQIVDLFNIWGNLPLMTGTAFVLFTNLAQAAKIANLLSKKRRILNVINEANDVLGAETNGEGMEIVKRPRDRNLAQAAKIVNLLSKKCRILNVINEANDVLGAETNGEGMEIVKRCNREMIFLQVVYLTLTLITTTGWASSAEKGQLPLRAWYPYDTSKSPAYEITYLHQVGAINIAACLNVGKDTLALIAQCRCRLQLLGLSLRTLCRGLEMTDKLVYTPEQEAIAAERLRNCVKQHQAALEAAKEIQSCFSAPTFFQFFVSLVIICVTAFQLISQTGNLVRLFSMGTYLLNMMFQVFIYCYQGHHLSEESADVAGYAYKCPWYACSVRLRKMILVIMTRTRRVTKITAGGFTTLSLGSFMAIIKASYSLFTLLQQVTE
ncbi:7tm odorant receptor domain-containing protein [Phthorimaea operculella]|nr:7tm odorant receptor domain-containing protein [Phthorimaea operculella]